MSPIEMPVGGNAAMISSAVTGLTLLLLGAAGLESGADKGAMLAIAVQLKKAKDKLEKEKMYVV